MRADEPGDTRPEERRDEARAAALVVAMIRGVGNVGDVVDEAGNRELAVVGVLGAQQRAALEGVRERVERGFVERPIAACEQREEVVDARGRGRHRSWASICAMSCWRCSAWSTFAPCGAPPATAAKLSRSRTGHAR